MDIRLSDQGASSVTLDGTEQADDVVVTPGNASGVVNVAGLSTPVTISNASKTNGQVGDQLTILGIGGDDHLTGRSGAESSIRLLLNGGDGDDVLSADATLIGGAGDDLFYPLAGTNTIDGGTGFDQIVVNGNDADNSITLGQTLSTVTIGVDGQTSVNDTSNVERIQINAMGGGAPSTSTRWRSPRSSRPGMATTRLTPPRSRPWP